MTVPLPLRRTHTVTFALAGLIAVSACTRVGTAPQGSHSLSTRAAPDSIAAALAVERVVADSFFAAITRYDFPQLLRAVTPSFELEEDTLRLSGPAFVEFLRPYQTIGTMRYRFEGFNTRVVGRTAWTSYWNRGTFTPAGGGAPEELSWLETAVLVWSPEAGWRIDRLHSTPKR